MSESADSDVKMPEEKDASVIYQHPQSQLLSKMAAVLKNKRSAPPLPSDPSPGDSDVRVLDRKEEAGEDQLKKDNRRWRGVVYLTVATCLVIVCLVVTQVVTSVNTKTLPNIDVASKDGQPQPEALIAALSVANDRTSPDQPQTGDPLQPIDIQSEATVVEAVVLETEVDKGEVELVLNESVKGAEALSGEPESRSGYVAYIPVSLGGEKDPSESTAVRQTSTTTTTPRPPVTLVRHRPFFVPVMFQQRGAAQRPLPVHRLRPPFSERLPSLSFTPPRPANRRPPFQVPPPTLPNRPLPFQVPPPVLANQQSPSHRLVQPSLSPSTNQKPLSQGHSAAPLHPHLFSTLKRPGAMQPTFNLQQNNNVVSDAPPIGLLPLDDENPFENRMDAILRHMHQLIRSVRPPASHEPALNKLPSNVSFSRLLAPRRPVGLPPRRPLRYPAGPPQTGRSFPPPPGYRPGPFRPPISVTPPQVTNQRGARPANQRRRFPQPPRGSAPHQRGYFPPSPGQQRNFPRPHSPLSHQLRPGSFGGGGNRFKTQRPTLLANNAQYSYPETATGIQDIIRYIQDGKQRPQNGHGSFNSFTQHRHQQNQPQQYSPNTRYSSSDSSSSSHHGGSSVYHNDGYDGGSNSYNGGSDVRVGSSSGDGYSGPIYPPGYNGQRFSLGSSERPFRLMLDVYPMEDSDRYSDSFAPPRLFFPDTSDVNEPAMFMEKALRLGPLPHPFFDEDHALGNFPRMEGMDSRDFLFVEDAEMLDNPDFIDMEEMSSDHIPFPFNMI